MIEQAFSSLGNSRVHVVDTERETVEIGTVDPNITLIALINSFFTELTVNKIYFVLLP